MHTFALLNRRSREAFTLIELLVVIAIMAMLMTLAVTGLGVAHNWTLSGNTERTLIKTHAKIDKYLERTVQQARSLDPDAARYPVANAMFPNYATSNRDRRAMKVVQLKELYRYRFPTNYWEILQGQQRGDPDATSMWEAFTAVYNRNPATVTRPTAEPDISAQAGACLALIYSRFGSLDSFSPQELKDTNGDGLRELCDAWGRPLLFYRYGYNAPAFFQARAREAYPPDPSGLTRLDPDDPERLLLTVWGNLNTNQRAAFTNTFGYDPRTATYFAPLVIISAGPDGVFGTADDMDSYRLKLSLTGQ
jgi:prepilin-type N-terminal cleavage/methylation domain-containing protein